MANSEKQVAVIGAGVMGEALISALITYGISPSAITISEKREERALELINRYKVASAVLSENIAKCDMILLVVKPQDMAAVLQEIKSDIRPGCLVISFVAGKQIRGIADLIGTSANPVIRVMPNTPTLVGAGMAAISCCSLVTEEQRQFVLGFFYPHIQVEGLQDILLVHLRYLDLSFSYFSSLRCCVAFRIRNYLCF